MNELELKELQVTFARLGKDLQCSKCNTFLSSKKVERKTKETGICKSCREGVNEDDTNQQTASDCQDCC